MTPARREIPFRLLLVISIINLTKAVRDEILSQFIPFHSSHFPHINSLFLNLNSNLWSENKMTSLVDKVSGIPPILLFAPLSICLSAVSFTNSFTKKNQKRVKKKIGNVQPSGQCWVQNNWKQERNVYLSISSPTTVLFLFVGWIGCLARWTNRREGGRERAQWAYE